MVGQAGHATCICLAYFDFCTIDTLQGGKCDPSLNYEGNHTSHKRIQSCSRNIPHAGSICIFIYIYRIDETFIDIRMVPTQIVTLLMIE